MDNQEKKEQASFTPYSCEHCKGSGFVSGKKCPHCKGAGMGGYLAGDLIYWGKPINRFQIVFDKTEKTVETVVNSVFFLFLIIGLGVFGYFIWKLDFLPLRSLSFWQDQPNLMAVFWLSLLGDLYLYYRLTTQSKSKQNVKKRSYEMAPDQPVSMNWQKKLMEKDIKYFDISKTFSYDSHQAIQKAWQLAGRLKNAEAVSIHLFAHLLSIKEIVFIFGRLGIGTKELADRLKKILAKLPVSQSKKSKVSNEMKEIFLAAYAEAYWNREEKVDPKELLIAVVKRNKTIVDLLYDYDIDLNKMVNVVQWIRVQETMRENYYKYRKKAQFKPKSNMDRAMTAIATPMLDSFSSDLTQLARMGYLAPCVDREKEVDSIFRAMEAGRKSVILVGNPGVGKKTIVEGLAQRMVAEEVPPILQDKRLVSISVPRLLSAAPGEIEARMVRIIDEIVRSGNIVVVVQSVQNMSGISLGGEESLDLTEVLVGPASKGLFFLIATTNPYDYSRYLEMKTIGNVLQKVMVEEPEDNEAIQIIEAKTGSIEYRNKVFFSYAAIEAVLDYTKRYIHDRFLPEKAINVLEEVAVHTRKKKGERSVVGEEEVAYIISEKTKVPVSKVSEKEGAKLLKLEDRIHERVINQEAAVEMVSASLRRARTELRDAKRPIANLLFLGPTGVGKTELAKTVAEVYFGNEENMIRLDMSEYQDKLSVHKLIGAPASGRSAQGGYLTEAVRKSPFSLVLLDEFEKAHPDILNIFLQVMDDGRLTDNVGRTIDFTNSIIIATSNAGTKYIQDEVKKGTDIEAIKQALMENVLKNIYRPELLNRFDGVMVFKPLSMANVISIARLLLKKVAARLEEKGIGFEATNMAVSQFAKAGFDPQYGARPLRRVIQEKVDDKLANLFLKGQLERRDKVIFEGIDQVRVEKAKRI